MSQSICKRGCAEIDEEKVVVRVRPDSDLPIMLCSDALWDFRQDFPKLNWFARHLAKK